MRRRRTELTIETKHLVLRRRTNHEPVWCHQCSASVDLVTPEEAATMLGVNPRAIYRALEAGQFHLNEVNELVPRLCLNSVLGSDITKR
jgi:hypothetical protein